MILDSLRVSREVFEAGTGWSVRPEGLCRGELCVPAEGLDGPTVDVRALADRMHMPLVADDAHGVWALGPLSLGRALVSAEAPDLVLPTIDGEEFALRSLRGQKIFLLAWASW